MADDNRQLLLRTHSGNEVAARELWRRFGPRMLAYARAILGRRDLACDGAEDVVQTVLLSILRMPARQLRSVEDVPAWLLRLTRNAALNHLRMLRRERARRTALQKADPPSPLANASDALVDDSLDRVRLALAALPRRDRELLVLKHIAGLTFDQLALALGINRSTAASRYRAARTLFARSLEMVPQRAGGHHA